MFNKGAKAVLLTLGERGAYLATGEERSSYWPFLSPSSIPLACVIFFVLFFRFWVGSCLAYAIEAPRQNAKHV